MNAAVQQSTPVKSGAAGAATFPGSDSRKYNYFEPKGRKATHYEAMTVDVQPDRALPSPGLDHFIPGRHPDLFQELDQGAEFELASVPLHRPGMGAHPLSAAVDDLRHGPGRHRKRAQIRRTQAHGQDLGQDPPR